jgi:hypothetical protein
MNSKTYKAPLYAAFSNLLPLHPSLVQIHSAPCSPVLNTLNPRSSLKIRSQISYPYRTIGKINNVINNIPFSTLLYSRREDKISGLKYIQLKCTFQFVAEVACPSCHQFYPPLVHEIRNNYFTPATSQYYARHHITNRLDLLGRWYDSLM